MAGSRPDAVAHTARRRAARARTRRARRAERTICTASAILLLALLTGRGDHLGLVVAGEEGPAAEVAALLQALLAADPAQRPESSRGVGTLLAEIASVVPDAGPVARPEPRRRRRARLAAALALLVVAGGSGVYVAGQRVGSPGPALSPGTVTVPVPPPASP